MTRSYWRTKVSEPAERIQPDDLMLLPLQVVQTVDRGFEWRHEGRDWRVQEWSGATWWLFRKHPDGQWVSMRVLRSEELEEVRRWSRIPPEQDYADKIAKAWLLPHEDPSIETAIAERRARFAALIRAKVRAEATEAWACFTSKGTHVRSFAHRPAADEYAEPRGYTVRRVLVLEVSE